MERKITIEEPSVYQEDYQMRMLYANEIAGLLPLRGRGQDGNSCYDYDVSGKISMRALFEREKMSGEDIRNFLVQLRSVLKEVDRYLLRASAILLQPDYLFYEDDQLFFCYYPPAKNDFWQAFHTLTEYFVKQANYEDKDCVRMVLYLHKETMKENYSLSKMMEACLGKKQPEHREETVTTQEEETIREAPSEELLLETPGKSWTPMKRFFGRRKKDKWGDWDGLYIEEEEWK